MGYPYEDLGEAQFEALVVQAARLKLGKGVQGFAPGVDGGRDARFEGLADGFPSAARPWEGITIVQAKHTMSYGYFSDKDFSGTSASSVLSEEIPRVKRLAEANQLANYMLFSNRGLTAGGNEAVINRIAEEAGLPRERIHLCGVEVLNECFRESPRLAELAGINPIDGPLIVSSRTLAEVVEAISTSLDVNARGAGSHPISRTTLAKKNELNSMTEVTSKRLRRNYFYLLRQIQDFLAEPGNVRIRKLYEDCAEDFDLRIIAHREEYQTFDKVFGYLVQLLVTRDSLLASNVRLTRAMVFYMYWHCDIGETEEDQDAISEQA